MATVSVPNGTILAVHLQKCSHLSNFFCIEFQSNKTINACTCGEHHNCSPQVQALIVYYFMSEVYIEV